MRASSHSYLRRRNSAARETSSSPPYKPKYASGTCSRSQRSNVACLERPSGRPSRRTFMRGTGCWRDRHQRRAPHAVGRPVVPTGGYGPPVSRDESRPGQPRFGMPIISSWSDRTKLRSSDIQVDIIFLMRSITSGAEKAAATPARPRLPAPRAAGMRPIPSQAAAGARLRASL